MVRVGALQTEIRQMSLKVLFLLFVQLIIRTEMKRLVPDIRFINILVKSPRQVDPTPGES